MIFISLAKIFPPPGLTFAKVAGNFEPFGARKRLKSRTETQVEELMQKLDLNDESLLDKFRETRDPSVFKTLLRRYQDRIYNMAFRMLDNAEEAEEVVQETCIKVHQGIHKFNRNCSFAAWIFRIAHNGCLDVIRARERRRAMRVVAVDANPIQEDESNFDTNVIADLPDSSPNPEESLVIREKDKFFAEKLLELPESQRMALVLHDIEGFSYLEIAEIVGEKMGTVRSRIHYGRQKLREILEPYYKSNTISQPTR